MPQLPASGVEPAPAPLWQRINASAANRLLVALVVAMVMAFAVEGQTSIELATLLVWCAGAWTYVLLGLIVILHSDVDSTRSHARGQDASDHAIFLLILCATLCAMVALVILQESVDELGRLEKASHLVLSVLALMASWGLMQLVYAFHYGRLYYADAAPGDAPGGLDFPGGQAPDFLDFMYHAAGVGMTFAGSGATPTSRRMRATVLVHGVMAFFFNMGVVSLSINLVASYL